MFPTLLSVSKYKVPPLQKQQGGKGFLSSLAVSQDRESGKGEPGGLPLPLPFVGASSPGEALCTSSDPHLLRTCPSCVPALGVCSVHSIQGQCFRFRSARAVLKNHPGLGCCARQRGGVTPGSPKTSVLQGLRFLSSLFLHLCLASQDQE